ncbi:hypothetical protein CBOM_01505 [Ceraceosorus bombacis]|uniref:Uncharacterized protein n=1 Tax=Ceraceosorus bombacis TaxID=401625 RepID=A0A0P1BBT5_9BASI|nr:hypothetical protein CBOM_01505 [Ceraceosorus bombacis]
MSEAEHRGMIWAHTQSWPLYVVTLLSREVQLLESGLPVYIKHALGRWIKHCAFPQTIL